MPVKFGTEVFENDVFKIYEDSNGDLVIEHKPSGNTSVLVNV